MKLLLLLPILLLAGCSVNELDKAKQDVACANHQGVFNYNAQVSRFVQCNDGSLQKWPDVIGPEVAERVEFHRTNKD